MTTYPWAIGLAILGATFGGIQAVLLKKGAHKFNLNIFKQIKNYYVLAGLTCSGLGMISFLAALTGGELSALYPIISFQYIVSTFLSVKFLKEKMNKLKWAGIIAIMVGISFIGLGA